MLAFNTLKIKSKKLSKKWQPTCTRKPFISVYNSENSQEINY
jgi:hypothetical protein